MNLPDYQDSKNCMTIVQMSLCVVPVRLWIQWNIVYCTLYIIECNKCETFIGHEITERFVGCNGDVILLRYK
jgi:hypothetical protein